MADVRYLGQSESAALDDELMGPCGFCLEQLMELAGLSVAQAVQDLSQQSSMQIVVLCGPGNNGGDGLVAARHLFHFGHDVTVVYPKVGKKEWYSSLVTQLKESNIPVEESLPSSLASADVIIDALFGFSFSGAVRPPYDAILGELRRIQTSSGQPKKPTIVAVDAPSGWDVEKGPQGNGDAVIPDVLVSLTAPKKCAEHFYGRHYLGGRFVPSSIQRKYRLELPAYPGASQCVELSTGKKGA
ncbi:unnamed protein product [Vitrella brassicaformis CCMP3155]|uniref:NAD(P)H-hydrate epimerase n=2 Tax=Vitrella brassicaformis TaxID=1169539 RepID=A0A0G4FM11_VITBC|nr:unnamed protein product [Vitrella brassicaformis CCMP3155]|eukprot:CEM14979.1 unnamed protein product [Vitrella brassicaformis CCMP3155]